MIHQNAESTSISMTSCLSGWWFPSQIASFSQLRRKIRNIRNHHQDNVYTGVPISYSLEIQSHSENGFMKPMLFGGDEGHPHSRSLTNILKIPRKIVEHLSLDVVGLTFSTILFDPFVKGPEKPQLNDSTTQRDRYN